MELRELKDKAAEAFTKGRFSRAAEVYEEYCRADPKDHQARLRMGDAWSKAGKKDRAVSAYQAAAEGFAREGFLPRAIAASKLILELDPKHQGVQQMLADLYARRGTPASARGRTSSSGTLLAPASPEPTTVGMSKLPPEVLAAVAQINLDEDEPLEQAPAVADSEEVIQVVGSGDGDDEGGITLNLDAAEVAAPDSAPAAEAPKAETSRLPPGLAPRAASQRGAAVAASGVPAGEGSVSQREVRPDLAAGVPHVSSSNAKSTTSGATLDGVASAAGATQGDASAEGVSASQPDSAPVASADVGAASPRDTRPEAMTLVGTSGSKWQALSTPIADSAGEGTSVGSTPSASSAPPGLRPRRAEPQAPAGATVLPTREVPPGLAMSLRSPAPSAFTELELEADSLLHAVELAAQAGLGQRAAPPVAIDDDEIFDLTEEVSADVAPRQDTLPTIPLFSDLPRDAFIELFERCPLRRFGLGERIISQGSTGDAFYVICEGRVRVFREERGQRHDLATLEGGTFFGEMALLSGAPRTASVESADDDTQLLEISAPVLADLSRDYPTVARALKKFCRERMLTNVMNTSALFQPFSRKDRRKLVERFRARAIERDDVVIREGDQTDGLYVILSGEVDISKEGHLLTKLREGELFGEISLLQKTPATATVKAARHTTLLRLPREDFDQVISSHPQILALISDLSEERLRRTERVLGAVNASPLAPPDADEELILV